MRNQAVRQGAQYGGRHDEYDDQAPNFDAYELRAGHHRGAEEDQQYDPRAYAPNPDEPYGYDDDGNPLFYAPERPSLGSGRSGAIMIAAVFGVAVLAGGGALAYKFMGSTLTGGEAPLIRAETEPVKTVPEKVAEKAPQKAIYDRVDLGSAPKSKVVSREEEPVELPSSTVTQPQIDGARVILPGGPASAEPTPPSTAGAEARRVKTVSIKPDASLAFATEPVQPQQPSSAPAADPIADLARGGPLPRSEFDNGIMAEDAPRTTSRAPARPAPQQPAATAQPAPRAAAPAPRATEPQQVAAVTPRAAAPVATPKPTAGGGFVVQVSSQRSEEDARSAYSALQRKFPQVLGSHQASIQSASVTGRGTYYRVRVGPFGSSADASSLCNSLRSAGGDCVVSRTN